MLREGSLVHPLYVRHGLYWEAEEVRHLRRFLEAVHQAALQPLRILEMPVADLSLNELSRRVGLAKSNVLRYFESREAVLLELLDSAWRDWLARLAEALPERVDATASASTRSRARYGRGSCSSR